MLVVEAEHVGFGASGRNGGWCSALFPVGPDALARRYGRNAALAMRAAMRDTVDEVGRVAAAEGIDCGFANGGTLVVARTAAQEAAGPGSADALGAPWGDGTVWLDAAAIGERVEASRCPRRDVHPDCARVQPRRLVAGWPPRCAGAGAGSSRAPRSCAIAARVGSSPTGQRIRAGSVVVATEAWTRALPGHDRTGGARVLADDRDRAAAAEPWAQIGLPSARPSPTTAT